MLSLREIMESDASDEAKAKGLDYLSFGRYGKDGHVTHVVDPKTHKLVPAPQGPQQSRDPARQPGVATYKPNANPDTGGSKTYKPDYDIDKMWNANADRIRMGTRKDPVEEPPQGSTAKKPSVSRSPDGSRGSKTPLAQEPKGDYGNPDMPTSMPKSTAPQPVEKPVSGYTQQDYDNDSQIHGWDQQDEEDRLSQALQTRDMIVQRMNKAQESGDEATLRKYYKGLKMVNDKIFGAVKKMDPKTMNPHVKQYLQNRGFIEPDRDPNDPEDWMNDDDAATEFDQGGYYTPRDASGASHFGPDN